jgi:hypothetical protein
MPYGRARGGDRSDHRERRPQMTADDQQMTNKAHKSNDQGLGDLAEAVLGVLDRDSERRVAGDGREPATSTPAATVFDENEPDTKRFLDGGSSGVHLKQDTDRRAARRVPLEVPVSLALDKGEVVDGTSEDISTSGLFVRTSRLVPSGRRVSIRFDLPHGVMNVTAVVVRFRTPSREMPGGIGLCFQTLSTEQTESLEAFCDAADSVRAS